MSAMKELFTQLQEMQRELAQLARRTRGAADVIQAQLRPRLSLRDVADNLEQIAHDMREAIGTADCIFEDCDQEAIDGSHYCEAHDAQERALAKGSQS